MVPLKQPFPTWDIFSNGADEQFARLYAPAIQQLDELHFSPLSVVEKAVQFLVNKPQVKILDIGSGSGKFCLAGAHHQPEAFFTGVEQRKYLVEHAIAAGRQLGLENVQFMHKNFTQLNFAAYDHFYFYNSFYENIDGVDKMDDTIDYSADLYNYYNRLLCRKLHELPPGTRIVTYKSLDYEIPAGYSLVETHWDNELKFWMKD